jgi:hypothetical protein
MTLPTVLTTPRSSATKYVAYYADDSVLEVQFVSELGASATYSYFGVPASVWGDLQGVLQAGGSVGKYVRRNVVGKYSHAPGAYRPVAATTVSAPASKPGRAERLAQELRGLRADSLPDNVVDFVRVRRALQYAGYDFSAVITSNALKQEDLRRERLKKVKSVLHDYGITPRR